jgi:hypothetical protein
VGSGTSPSRVTIGTSKGPQGRNSIAFRLVYNITSGQERITGDARSAFYGRRGPGQSYGSRVAAYAKMQRHQYVGFGTTAGEAHWGMFLYEPDKVIRRAKVQLIRQSKYVPLVFYVYSPGPPSTFFYGYITAAAAPEDCFAQLKLKDADLNGTFETKKWIGKCKPGALDALGFTATQRNALKRLFGSSSIVKVSGQVP